MSGASHSLSCEYSRTHSVIICLWKSLCGKVSAVRVRVLVLVQLLQRVLLGLCDLRRRFGLHVAGTRVLHVSTLGLWSLVQRGVFHHFLEHLNDGHMLLHYRHKGVLGQVSGPANVLILVMEVVQLPIPQVAAERPACTCGRSRTSNGIQRRLTTTAANDSRSHPRASTGTSVWLVVSWVPH